MVKYFIRLVVCLAVLAITADSAEALDKHYYAPTSKLAEGQWVKIAVQESGICQITAADVSNWGLGSDLSQIHIFGYGGAPLSEVMLGDNYFDDLPQVPVVRSGDRILFYAQGSTTWKRKNNIIPYVQVQHPYANMGCYLVTNSALYDDIDITLADNTPTGPLKSTYIERLYHEQDIINPGHTGRNYLGESFVSNRSQMFQFDLNGLVDSSMVSVYPVFAAKTTDANSSLTYWYNGTQLAQTSADIIPTCYNLSYEHYTLAKTVKQFTLDGTDQLWFKVNFSCLGTVHEARLDFITVNYEVFDINELIRRTLITFEARISEKQMELDVRFANEQSFVYADSNQISQVLRNLIDNAIKYSPEGRTLLVSTYALRKEVYVTIRDTGVGIPAEDVPHIFDRFYKVEKAHTPSPQVGSGLGLAIVKKIIEAHGQSITVKSARGKGTQFTFTLEKANTLKRVTDGGRK